MPKSLVRKETERSKRGRGREDFHPAEDIEYAFTAWLKCGQPKCGQEVVVSGDGGYEPDYDGEGMTWTAYFIPRYCFPMPDVIELPEKCPKEIKVELRGAFALIWADRGAAAGRLRVVLERLMDILAVQKRQKNKHGKFSDLSLHGRIELFEKKNPTAGTQLMALKWLGNAGSHEGAVSRDDLMDAFEILEHSLAELIDRRPAKVAALAKRLIKKHAQRRR